LKNNENFNNLQINFSPKIKLIESPDRTNLNNLLWRCNKKHHNQKKLNWVFKKYWLNFIYYKIKFVCEPMDKYVARSYLSHLLRFFACHPRLLGICASFPFRRKEKIIRCWGRNSGGKNFKYLGSNKFAYSAELNRWSLINLMPSLLGALPTGKPAVGGRQKIKTNYLISFNNKLSIELSSNFKYLTHFRNTLINKFDQTNKINILLNKQSKNINNKFYNIKLINYFNTKNNLFLITHFLI
jgi:hypothetical protein